MIDRRICPKCLVPREEKNGVLVCPRCGSKPHRRPKLRCQPGPHQRGEALSEAKGQRSNP